MELFLEYAFVSLADVIQKSEFALGSSLQLAVVFCLHVSMKKTYFLPHVAYSSCASCSCDCTLYSRDFTYPSEHILSDTLNKAGYE